MSMKCSSIPFMSLLLRVIRTMKSRIHMSLKWKGVWGHTHLNVVHVFPEKVPSHTISHCLFKNRDNNREWFWTPNREYIIWNAAQMKVVRRRRHAQKRSENPYISVIDLKSGRNILRASKMKMSSRPRKTEKNVHHLSNTICHICLE